MQLGEGIDVTALTVGATMPALVVCMDDEIARREPGTDVVVAAAVLGESVHQDERALRIRRQPGAPEQAGAVSGCEVRGRAANDAAFHVANLDVARAARQLRDHDERSWRRTSACAARTRWR